MTFKNGAGTVIKTVDPTYDAFNRWLSRTVDPDGATGSATLQTTNFVHDGNQTVLQFTGSTAATLDHRYLWGPAIDHFCGFLEMPCF